MVPIFKKQKVHTHLHSLCQELHRYLKNRNL